MASRYGAARAVDLRPAGGASYLCALADQTLANYLCHLASFGGAISEGNGLLLVAGAHSQPNPYRNAALRLTGPLSADEVIGSADRFFGARRRGYVLWVRDHGDADLVDAAEDAQFMELERLPELVLDRLPPPMALPDGVELRQARDSHTRSDYLTVVASAWGMAGMPRQLAADVFFDPESLDAPNIAAFVAYYDDKPLSGAMTYVSCGVALGCQAATIRRPMRGQKLPPPPESKEARSLAQSCLWAALAVSFERLGVRLSLCQTSVQGAPVWQQFGYRPFTSYRRFLVPVGGRS